MAKVRQKIPNAQATCPNPISSYVFLHFSPKKYQLRTYFFGPNFFRCTRMMYAELYGRRRLEPSWLVAFLRKIKNSKFTGHSTKINKNGTITKRKKLKKMITNKN